MAAERTPLRLPPRGGVVVAALAAPQSEGADTALTSCPYHFGSDMPAATFCVYQGVAFDAGGEVCATDVVVMWSSLVAQGLESPDGAMKASASNKEVYLGFVADPELVVRAMADPRRNDRAEMVEYTLGDEDAPKLLAGKVTLRARRPGSTGTASGLAIELREPQHFRPGGCAFASYSGTYLGIIRPPSETATSANPSTVPQQ